MIKPLIEDIAFNRIAFSEALTRAKIIAYRIKNDDFKEWINYELNGYKDNAHLPDYRVLKCEIFAVIQMPYQGVRTIPFDVSNLENDLKGRHSSSFYKMNILQSIPTLEGNIKIAEGQEFGFEELPLQLVNLLKEMADDGHLISNVRRRIQISELKHIVELSKQKLLDTLLELNDAFPNLEADFSSNKNDERTQTIIHQNIYGNNPNLNLAVGNNISQSNDYKQKIDTVINELESAGIDTEELSELKQILSSKTDKVSMGKKVLDWIGRVTTKALEKGIELQIPTIIDKVKDFL